MLPLLHFLQDRSRRNPKQLSYQHHNPKDADTRVVLGFVYYDLGDLSNAKMQFEAVLKRYPDYAGAHKGLVLIKRREEGKNDPRLAKIRSIEEIKIEHHAENLEKKHQYKKALAIWMELDNDHPYDADYLYHIGRTYHAMKKQKEAERYLAIALR